MTELDMKNEIKGYIRNSGFEANSKMLCSIVKLMNMKHADIDKKRVISVTNEIISERI
ncbi:MAG: hypothetical protein GY932_01705 [Arcobacter sp.]|nr:hypothetical protein [Arcobacter sp.]